MKADRISSIFWLSLSIYVLIESLHLGIGTLGNPGIGFLSFGASAILGILSLLLFLQTVHKQGARFEPILGVLWKRVMLVLILLVIYAKLMPFAGYIISTFSLMSLLFWIVRRGKGWWVPVSAVLTTITTYYIFSKWLNCQFPKGLFGF